MNCARPMASEPGWEEYIMRQRILRLLTVITATACLASGCATRRQTDPPRTATEQLLLSTAADRALQDTDLRQFAHKKVFLDSTYFESYDSKYVIGLIRDVLCSQGALLVTDVKQSEITIEARSGAHSTDDRTIFFGIPALGIPVPFSGTITTPELAFFKSQTQHSTSKFALLAYETQSREHVFSSGPMVGKAHNTYLNIIFVPVHATDVPEIKKSKKHHHDEWEKK